MWEMEEERDRMVGCSEGGGGVAAGVDIRGGSIVLLLLIINFR